MKAAVPVAASAVGFGGLHLFLRHGPCHSRLEKMYSRRKARGLIPSAAEPSVLASQASFRVLNEVHNVLAVPLAIVLMFDRALNKDTIHGFNSLARTLTLVSAGYFLVDGTVVLKNLKEHGPEPLTHAVICITFFVYSAVRQQLQYYAPRVIFFELSTPFVHLRWFLYSLGLQKTKLYKANGLAMICSFTVCRMVWGTKLLTTFLTSAYKYRKNPPLVKSPMGKVASRIIGFMGCGITVLNYFWYYKMMRGAFKVFFKNKTA